MFEEIKEVKGEKGVDRREREREKQGRKNEPRIVLLLLLPCLSFFFPAFTCCLLWLLLCVYPLIYSYVTVCLAERLN